MQAPRLVGNIRNSECFPASSLLLLCSFRAFRPDFPSLSWWVVIFPHCSCSCGAAEASAWMDPSSTPDLGAARLVSSRLFLTEPSGMLLSIPVCWPAGLSAPPGEMAATFGHKRSDAYPVEELMCWDVAVLKAAPPAERRVDVSPPMLHFARGR